MFLTHLFLIYRRLFFILFAILIIGCNSKRSRLDDEIIHEGGQLAQIHCTSCHVFTPPTLLDKDTWQLNVLPRMGRRLGMDHHSILNYPNISPIWQLNEPVMEQEEWEKIVAYFIERSPQKMPKAILPSVPEVDPSMFKVSNFTDSLSGSSIITMLKYDSISRKVFAADGMTNTLYKLDLDGKVVQQLNLDSPPTDMVLLENGFDITLPGILHPNNENKGTILRQEETMQFNPGSINVILDSLYRPVRSIYKDFSNDGRPDYIVCEYGNDIGRLTFYRATSSGKFSREIIEEIPGSISMEHYDFNKDGHDDVVVLFAQGDERIVIYYNDGLGNFNVDNTKIVARYPAVYGSMFIDLKDFNNDGHMDILYVCGDNFDYSMILKPYHGIRILENDGSDDFKQKYFFSIYGAAKAEVNDFDGDGDLDMMVAANFADMNNNPERGIMYFECNGIYNYTPYSFRAASDNQWNTITSGDFDMDGDLDILVGAMYLQNVLTIQKVNNAEDIEKKRASILLFENTLK